MKRRPRFLPPPLEKPERNTPTWAIRLIAIVAIAIVVGALVVAAATGTLFTAPASH